jgi:hypothetical protein
MVIIELSLSAVQDLCASESSGWKLHACLLIAQILHRGFDYYSCVLHNTCRLIVCFRADSDCFRASPLPGDFGLCPLNLKRPTTPLSGIC